jgi:cytochrome c-type biogenesis protein CcmF
MVLVSATFLLSILGTTLTRTGLVQSVHAFAQSPIKPYFTTFLLATLALVIYAIVRNLPFLKSEAKLESVVSRESSFLFNNLILLASCFAILWGTLFPVVMEALTNEKETIDSPYYLRVEIPIGLFLLFLTGVGPLIAWRRSSLDSLRRAFLLPTIMGILVAGGLFASGVHHPAALLSFGLCAFVIATILSEFWKGSRAIELKEKLSFPRAAFELTWRNTRRYGGYLVHLGIVAIFVGFTGSAFNLHDTRNLGLGESVRFGHYDLKLASVNDGDNDNYQFSHAALSVFRNGEQIGLLEPEIRLYKASQSQNTLVALRRSLREDLYVVYAGVLPDGKKATFQLYQLPLVSWIWIGFGVVLFGTIICLVPSKVRYQYARTEVVGLASKPETVRS